MKMVMMEKNINMNRDGKLKTKRFKGVGAVFIITLMTITMLFGTAACSNNNKVNEMEVVEKLLESGQEDVMLVNYFEHVVGTEEEQGYFEIVLYAVPDEEGKLSTETVRMDVYTDGGLRSEKVTTYTDVPYSVFEDVMNVIKEYKMAEWSEMDNLDSIDGCDYVCKFPAGDIYCRVSSEAMPENGLEAFKTILESLSIEELKELLKEIN